MSKQPKRRLYECEECHQRRWIPWVEFNRAARPKCYGCGSSRLELVSENAKKDRQRLQQERVAGSGGSLELAKHLDSTRRKVT